MTATRVALVTGSTSGIGEATAKKFAQAGYAVVFNSAHSVEAGQQLAATVTGAHYVQADITQPDECARLVSEVLERCGRLDVLVNNAGATRIIRHHDLTGATIEVWRELFEVNVFGTWSMSVAAMEALRAQHGAIVNVSSIAGLRPTGSSIPYAASKAALNHLTVLLASVVGPEVRVNAVAPGLIDTPWTADWDAVRTVVQAIAPLKRSGTAHEVADVIFALVSSSYVTGEIVTVDGGLSLAR